MCKLQQKNVWPGCGKEQPRGGKEKGQPKQAVLLEVTGFKTDPDAVTEDHSLPGFEKCFLWTRTTRSGRPM